MSFVERRGQGAARALLASLLVLAAGCSDGGEGSSRRDRATGPGDELRAKLMDPSVDSATRVARILAEASPGNRSAIPALLHAMKDRSQCSFLLEADPAHPLGYVAVEYKEIGPDTRALERVAAICALEKIGGAVPLADFALALEDRSPVVANHAARALVRLGCRAGLETLVFHLEGRVYPSGDDLPSPAFAGETAHTILEEITGETVDFSPDAGLEAKLGAAARWRGKLAELAARGGRLRLEGSPYQVGLDGEADRRLRFHVAMLGQFSFLFHEQARKALSRIGLPVLPLLGEAVESAQAALAGGDPGGGNATTLGGIAQVLASLRHDEARRLLEELLRSAPSAVRARAAEALAGQEPAAAERVLLPVLEDADAAVRIAACRALGTIASGQGATRDGMLARLAEATADPDAAVARAARLARFRGSGGRLEKDYTLSLLGSTVVAERNLAHEVLKLVTGRDGGFDPKGGDAARAAAIERYRKLLP